MRRGAPLADSGDQASRIVGVGKAGAGMLTCRADPAPLPLYERPTKQVGRHQQFVVASDVAGEIGGIGCDILVRQDSAGWGAKIVDRLSADLRRDFPEMTGFSPRNLKYMRALAEAFPNREIVQQVIAQLPWGHAITLMEAVKDPYSFDFLGLGADISERELERSLLDHLRSLILELGKGFAFGGRQYHLEVAGRDYYLDLLFYHLHLRCYVVIELKIEDFKPEFAGKMNFYLSAVNDLLRHTDDAPTIGIILCQGKNAVVVEYALRASGKPMGVAEYTLSEALPAPLLAALPTAEDLARELSVLSLVKLRIDVERELRKLAEDADRTVDRPISLDELIRANEDVRQFPSTTEFMRIVNTLHNAAHGIDVPQAEADQAKTISKSFLLDLRDYQAPPEMPSYRSLLKPKAVPQLSSATPPILNAQGT